MKTARGGHIVSFSLPYSPVVTLLLGKQELIKSEKGHGVCLSEGHGRSRGGKVWREESKLNVQNGKERKSKSVQLNSFTQGFLSVFLSSLGGCCFS